MDLEVDLSHGNYGVVNAVLHSTFAIALWGLAAKAGVLERYGFEEALAGDVGREELVWHVPPAVDQAGLAPVARSVGSLSNLKRLELGFSQCSGLCSSQLSGVSKVKGLHE